MSLRSRRLLVVLLTLTGCSGSARPPTSSPPASASQDTDLGLEELRKSLESTVLENNLQLSYGNIEAFIDGVSADRELQLVGVTPKDVLIGVRPAGLSVDRRIYRHRIKDGLRILSKNLDVHLSVDGSVGWIYDEMSYRVMYMGREASIPIRVTGVYVRDVERWVLVAEHMSYGLASDDIVNLKARGKLAVGKRLESDYGTSKELGAYLVGLVGQFTNAGYAAAEVAPADDVLVLLPGSDQEFHGQEVLDAPALAAAFGEVSTVSVEEFRLQIAPSKRVAWMLANLSVQTERNGDAVQIPLRASFVLERRTDRTWELMQAHVSAALHERQLTERVFGPN